MNNEADEIAEIVDSIKRAYGSLSRPNWNFVWRVIEDDPYKDLFERTREGFHLNVEYDPNYEVCYECSISRGDLVWSLCLSMVGPFAMLHKVHGQVTAPGVRFELIEPDNIPDDSKELFGLLDEFGIKLLNKDQIGHEIEFNIPNFQRPDPRIYHALFRFLEDLPLAVEQ